MCLSGNEATMIETLQALNDARLQLVEWNADQDRCTPRSLDVTIEEGIEIFERRIGTLEAKCRELGCHGPAPKADAGDKRRILAQR